MVYLLISMRSGLSLIDTGKVLFLRKEYIRLRDWSATFNINDHSQKKMSLLHYIDPRLIMNALKKRDLSPLAIYPNCIIPEVLWTAFLMTNFFQMIKFIYLKKIDAINLAFFNLYQKQKQKSTCHAKYISCFVLYFK